VSPTVLRDINMHVVLPSSCKWEHWLGTSTNLTFASNMVCCKVHVTDWWSYNSTNK